LLTIRKNSEERALNKLDTATPVKFPALAPGAIPRWLFAKAFVVNKLNGFAFFAPIRKGPASHS
jgi:hypothetical protein